MKPTKSPKDKAPQAEHTERQQLPNELTLDTLAGHLGVPKLNKIAWMFEVRTGRRKPAKTPAEGAPPEGVPPPAVA